MKSALAVSAFFAAQQLACAAVSQSPISVRFESLTVADVGPDKIQLEVKFGVMTRMKLTLKSARFQTMRMNGVPMYIAPLDEKLELDASPSWHPVRLAPITLYFRDLGTLAPIRQAVVEKAAHFEGEARVELDLSLAPRIVLPFRQTVPVNIPGGEMGRKAVLGTLSAAEFAVQRGGELAEKIRKYFGKNDEIARQYRPSLWLVETRYRYISEGHRVERSVQSTAFLIAPRRLMTTAEALQPWMYDAESAQALDSHAAVLDDAFYDVRAWPAEAAVRDDTALSLHKSTLRIASVGSETENVVVAAAGKIRAVKLGKRDSDANVGILDLENPPPGGAPVHDASMDDYEVDHVALFRFALDRPDAEASSIFVRVRRRDGRLALSGSVDSTAFGSPLVLPSGAIGMVQDENSGVVLEKLAVKPHDRTQDELVRTK